MAQRWTEIELEFASDNYGILTPRQLSKKLNRSTRAIINKMSRNGIAITDNYYTARMLGAEIGRHYTTVMQWYRKGWLSGKLSEWKRGYLNSPYIFTEQNIVKFLRQYSKLFVNHIRKIPNLYFRNILKKQLEVINVLH